MPDYQTCVFGRSLRGATERRGGGCSLAARRRVSSHPFRIVEISGRTAFTDDALRIRPTRPHSLAAFGDSLGRPVFFGLTFRSALSDRPKRSAMPRCLRQPLRLARRQRLATTGHHDRDPNRQPKPANKGKKLGTQAGRVFNFPRNQNFLRPDAFSSHENMPASGFICRHLFPR
jgi:hypothetical protein